MKFLDHFRPIIIGRGLAYFHNGNVRSVKMINAHTYRGVVEGTYEYEVEIDLDNPEKSSCTCPYAQDGNLCKHVVALYYEVFPEEVLRYARENEEYDYDEEYEDWQEYDDDNEYYYRNTFIKPYYFDYLLEEFVMSLSNLERKELLVKCLNEDKELTYRKFLKDRHNELSNDIRIRKIEEVNSQIQYAVNSRNYYDRFYDHFQPIITDDLKQYLINTNDRIVVNAMCEIFSDERIYTFDDNLFFVEYLKERMSIHEIDELKDRLHDFYTDLKNSGVRRTVTSNILIAIQGLEGRQEPSVLAKNIIENMRYVDYVKNTIESCEDKEALYEEFRRIYKNDFKHRRDISEVYRLFYEATGILEAKELSHYYGFVYNHNLVDLDELVICNDFDSKYYQKLIDTKQDFVLKSTYEKLNKVDELYEHLRSTDDYTAIAYYGVLLQSKYHYELVEIYKRKFYEKISVANKRDQYREACYYVRALKLLSDGDKLYDELEKELKLDPRYAKRSALFDEMRNV